MSPRYFNAAVILFWLVAMSWLLSQKVIPPLLPGDPPDYQAALPEKEEVAPPVCWRIEWNGRPIGIAASQPVATEEGAELRSVIRFTRLPVRDILKQLLGVMAGMLGDSFGDDDFAPNMVVATRLRFDATKHLDNFQTVVDLQELPKFIVLDGDVDAAGKLKLLATARYGPSLPGAPAPVVTQRQELTLPRDALVGDSLSPRSELRNLRVGQQWTIPTYRPFPPNSPVQILLAKVERDEFITHNGELVQTLVVVYHDEAGSGLGTAREPVGRAWVEPNGTILRQEVMLSNLRFTFTRLPDTEITDATRWLEDEEFAKFFAEESKDQ